MKNLIVLSALLFTGSFANADSKGYLLPLQSYEVHVYMPPQMATVQPYAMLHVKVTSCAIRNLDVVVKEKRGSSVESGNTLSIAVYDKDERDCHGPEITRNYELQISSDFHPRTSLKVENPLAPIFH